MFNTLKKSAFGLHVLAVVSAVLIAPQAWAADPSTVTVAGYGGGLQDALIATLWGPAAEKAGLKLRTESHDGQPAVRLQVQ
ncbi:hypothetical protein, partial [Klebsiella pneumoniae]